MRNLHLNLTNGKQLVEGFHYNIDHFDVLRFKFPGAPFFKIFCYLAETAEIVNFNKSILHDFLFCV